MDSSLIDELLHRVSKLLDLRRFQLFPQLQNRNRPDSALVKNQSHLSDLLVGILHNAESNGEVRNGPPTRMRETEPPLIFVLREVCQSTFSGPVASYRRM